MATSRVRRDKLESVSQSLHYDSSFKSNQGKVWENIRDTEVELNVSSNTSALNDSYKQRSNDIDDYKKAFTLHDKQNGLLVYINGRIVGLEIIYNSSRYAEYHEKLVESYIIDAISKKDEDYENEEINEDELFRQIKQSKRERFESVGLGEDYRMQNEDITGSAVIFEDNLVNASFFRNVKT